MEGPNFRKAPKKDAIICVKKGKTLGWREPTQKGSAGKFKNFPIKKRAPETLKGKKGKKEPFFPLRKGNKKVKRRNPLKKVGKNLFKR